MKTIHLQKLSRGESCTVWNTTSEMIHVVDAEEFTWTLLPGLIREYAAERNGLTYAVSPQPDKFCEITGAEPRVEYYGTVETKFICACCPNEVTDPRSNCCGECIQKLIEELHNTVANQRGSVKPARCECGAHATRNPNLHSDWCAAKEEEKG